MDSKEVKPSAPNLDKTVAKVLKFSDRLREMMAAKGVHAKDVGLVADVSSFTVGRWVRGESLPTVAQALLLDGYFGSTLAEGFKTVLRPEKAGKELPPKKPAAEKEEAKKEANSAANPFVGAMRLTKAVSDTFAQARKEVYGDDGSGSGNELEDLSDRRMVLALLSQVLDCLRLVLENEINAE